MKKPEDLKIVFFGAGAIGGSLGAWTSLRHANTFLLARSPSAEVIAAKGITIYPGDEPAQIEHIPVKVIRSLDEIPDADVVVMGVKLYDLEIAAQKVKEKLGDRALVLGLQNGVEGEKILPRYFSRVAFGVVTYNAWVDEPGTIGYQRLGSIILGTLNNSLQDELKTLKFLLGTGCKTEITQQIQDAAHCKLAINLANSVTTLIGPDYRKINDLDLYQDILANTIYEGVQVIRRVGFHEEKQGGLPSWMTLWAAAKLPHFVTRRTFQRNIQKMTLSSMGQDVFQRKSNQTELEYLNGYMLQLADQFHMNLPYNRAIYRLCKQHFSQPDFQPLDVHEVWKEIKQNQL